MCVPKKTISRPKVVNQIEQCIDTFGLRCNLHLLIIYLLCKTRGKDPLYMSVTCNNRNKDEYTYSYTYVCVCVCVCVCVSFRLAPNVLLCAVSYTSRGALAETTIHTIPSSPSLVYTDRPDTRGVCPGQRGSKRK